MVDYLKSKHILEERINIDGIPAILFRPKEEEGLLPTIIFYHGWSSNKEKQRLRGFILASLGYQVAIPDAIYHGEREPLSSYNVKNASKYFWQVIFNNMEEASAIIDKLVSEYDADANRIGVIGHSMGGFTAAGIFTHNPRIKALVVLNGSCYWENSNEFFERNLHIGEGQKDEVVRERVSQLDPMNNIDLIVNRPILMLHGDKDTSVPIESQKLFYDKVQPMYEDKDRIKLVSYPNLNHFVTTNMMEETIGWFSRYL